MGWCQGFEQRFAFFASECPSLGVPVPCCTDRLCLPPGDYPVSPGSVVSGPLCTVFLGALGTELPGRGYGPGSRLGIPAGLAVSMPGFEGPLVLSDPLQQLALF